MLKNEKQITKTFILIFLFFIFSFFFLSASSASAVDHYVRPTSECANNGNGTTWVCAVSVGATGAFNILPSTLVRGDTYYIADGTYGSYTFNTLEKENQYIYIKKATKSSHGSDDVNWNDSYGDEQVIFSEETATEGTPIINFTTGYWVFDGMIGAGSDISSYGFKVSPVNPKRINYLIAAPGVGYSNVQIDHIRISHTAMPLPGEKIEDQKNIYDFRQISFYSNPGSFGAHDLTISNNYMSNGCNLILLRNLNNGSNLSNTIIENNYFDGNWSSSLNHGGMIVPGEGCYDVTVRNNIFRNPRVYAIDFHKTGLVVTDHKIGNSGWKVYNNIVIGGNVSGIFATGSSNWYNVVINSYFHHNTFINVDCGGLGIVGVGNIDIENGESYAYNNLAYNCDNPVMGNASYTPNQIIRDYNGYLSCTGKYDSGNNNIVNALADDPFVGLNIENFRLKSNVETANAGKTNLGFPYNRNDYYGQARMAIPDIGAAEVSETIPPDTTSPANPSGLSVR